MRRSALAALVAAILLLGLATPAFAAGPSREPFPAATVQLAAGAVCAFPTTLEPVSNEYVIAFADRFIVTGRLTVTVTNDLTGESIAANISGPGVFVPHDDGSLSVDGGGSWLIWTYVTDPIGPRLWLTNGRMHLEIAADGSTTAFTLRGTHTDLCALLG